MTTTKFILDSRARQADGRAALKISVSKMGATSYITTGVSLFPEEWDVKKSRVVKHPQKKMMNLVIQQRKVQFDTVLYRLTMEGRLALMTAAQVRDAVQTEIDPYLRFAAGTYYPLFPQLTTYWARHTWATIAAELDIPKETIAAALGHGGNTVTDIYIDFDQKKIDEANRQVMDYVLYRRRPERK